MTKIFAEICVLKPEETIVLVEELISHGCAVVVRANGYDPGAPSIFVHGYDKVDDVEIDVCDVHEHFENMLNLTGGHLLEVGRGHLDTQDAVAPPFELSFAVDVFDDTTGIMRRISCAEYSRDRFVMIMTEAAGRFANTHGKSIGNALARRILLAALGPIDDEAEEETSDQAA